MVVLTDSRRANSGRVMTVDHIRYDILTQDALRGLVRTVLGDAARNGLPGDHHFYISFDPRHEGVKLSQRMRAQYPEEMTIVLQHQFWDLAVTEDRFEVGLSFGGVPERVVVPFAAIKGFLDPSVQFAMQFEQILDTEVPAPGDAVKPGRPPAEHKHSRPSPDAPAVPAAANPPSANPADAPAGGGEVVRLDRFRKK
jgi:hypothetical protein